ncbi:MAG: holin family protein [Deltaproteobacteria bacterium]
MGLIAELLKALFGNGNQVKQIAEVFRANAENTSERDASYAQAALAQFGAEFAVPRQGWFDRFMDGLNRVPRPALALGTLGLFVAAMVDPVWFASRMQGIALVPEPMWWLMGAIVSFYFGARSQVKGADFQRSIADTLARAGTVASNIRALDALGAGAGEVVQPVPPATPTGNAALDDWRRADAT